MTKSEEIFKELGLQVAVEIAIMAHAEQTRQGDTLETYVEHPIRVAKLIQKHYSMIDMTPDNSLLCAAILHDVLEDTSLNCLDLLEFGVSDSEIGLIFDVSDVPGLTGSRAQRKFFQRKITAGICERSKIIKMFDVLDNLTCDTKLPEDFRKIYLAEKVLVIQECLTPTKTSSKLYVDLFEGFINALPEGIQLD